MSERSDQLLQELGKRDLSPRQQEVLAELRRRLATPQGPPMPPEMGGEPGPQPLGPALEPPPEMGQAKAAPEAAPQGSWLRRTLETIGGASPEIVSEGLLPQEPVGATPEERQQMRGVKTSSRRTMAKTGTAGAISTATGLSGAALGTALLGPVGTIPGEIVGDVVGYGVNVMLGLEEPSWLGLGLNALPGVLPAVQAPLRSLAKSSTVGKTAVRSADEAAYGAYQARRAADIQSAEDANTIIKKAHEAARQARQADIARLKADNATAKAEHETLENAMKNQRAYEWQQRQWEIDARDAEIARIEADNARAASDYEGMRAVYAEQRGMMEQINKDTTIRFEAITEAEKANYDKLRRVNAKIASGMQTRKEAIRVKAQGESAANIGRMEEWTAQKFVDVPTKEAVDGLYDDLDLSLKSHNVELTAPKYRAVQDRLKAWGEQTTKFPHGEELQARMQPYLKGLKENKPFTLRELTEGTSLLGAQARSLRKRVRNGEQWAEQELRATEELRAALNTTLDDAAETSGVVGQIQMQMREARTAYRLRETYLDMQDFVQDMKTISPTGEEALNPIQALKALESKGYTNLKGWLKQMPGDKAGTTLYDDTVANLQTLAKLQMTMPDSVRWYSQMKATGDPRGKLYDIRPPRSPGQPPPRTHTPPYQDLPAVPPRGEAPQATVPERLGPLRDDEYLTPNPPQAPTPGPVPEPLGPLDPASLARVPEAPPSWAQQAAHLPPIRSGPLASAAPYGPAAAAAVVSGMLNPYMPWASSPGLGTGIATGVGIAMIGLEKWMASLLMNPRGQKLLVKLIEERGLRLDPVTTGILTAAARQGLSYGLPQDEAPQP